MASQGGLTRRRGAGAAVSADNEESSSRVASPAPKQNPFDSPETAREVSENGHVIAYDPRDMSESAERSKQPKLTLMEEVLLLGLKDKQVSGTAQIRRKRNADRVRGTSHFGMTTYLTRFEAVL